MKIASRRPFFLLAGAALLGAAALVLMQPAEAPVPELTPPAAGAVPAPPAAFAPIPMSSAPATAAANTGGLQLKGVLGFSGGAGAAIFALPDGRQRRVAVGGEVVPGARLVSISVDRAIIHDGVQQLELALPELRSGDTPAAAMPPMPMSVQTPAVVTPDIDRDAADLPLAVQVEGDARQPRGYRFTGAAQVPVLESAGLHPGDLILAVNGEPLDQARLLQLPAEIAAAESVTIDIERDGRRITTAIPKN